MKNQIFRRHSALFHALRHPLRRLFFSILVGGSALLACLALKQQLVDEQEALGAKLQQMAIDATAHQTQLLRFQQASPLITQLSNPLLAEKSPEALSRQLLTAWPGPSSPRSGTTSAPVHPLGLPAGWHESQLELRLRPQHAEQLMVFAERLVSLEGGIGLLRRCDIRRPAADASPPHTELITHCKMAWFTFQPAQTP